MAKFDIWFKSLILGMAMVYAISIISILMVLVLTAAAPLPDKTYIDRSLTVALALWILLAFYIGHKNYKRRKVKRAMLPIFLGLPISLGWFLSLTQGNISYFHHGMFLSSVFLSYEYFVAKQKMKNIPALKSPDQV